MSNLNPAVLQFRLKTSSSALFEQVYVSPSLYENVAPAFKLVLSSTLTMAHFSGGHYVQTSLLGRYLSQLYFA